MLSTIYWFCFSIGGIFVTLAVLGGLDGVEFEFEPDPDLDWADQADRVASVRSHRRSRRFSPFDILRSFKFWTFSSCFFGLTGLVLSYLPVGLNPILVLLIAMAMGLLAGTSISSILLSLRHQQADSMVRSDDLIGLRGVVEIPVAANSKGKVRLNVKGITRDYVAMTDSEEPLGAGQVVMIVDTQNNCLCVVAEDPLQS